MRLVPFEPAHLARLELQPAQAEWRGRVSGHDWSHLVGYAWTALDGDEVLACAGILQHQPWRGEAWAFLGRDAGRAMVPITRAVWRGIAQSPLRRVEAVVRADFPQGRRWVQMMGFRFEGLMHGFLEDGTDAERWARVD